MYMLSSIILLLLVIGLAIYDLGTKRISNWVTLPLLITGIVIHYPGQTITWIACLMLFVSWYMGAAGGGDTKLWMALLWLAPPAQAEVAVAVMALTFILTALGQFGWRKLKKRSMYGLKTAAAWRMIPFTVWMLSTT